jgi:aryl-alcohol dehydrogenase-like predicted oxidoreductase
MQTRKLGNTEFQISAIGLGAWAMGGGGWTFGWGPQDDRESMAAIHRALDLGINWIDTAAVYGLGRSEQVVAQALAEVPSSNRPLVFTKCSLTWDDRGSISHNLEPASLLKEVESSLRRLHVETIDLYQIHWPNFTGGESPSPGIEAAWQTLTEMKKAGKVRYIGVSNFNTRELQRVGQIAPVSSLQPPYSMLRRGVEAEILPYCASHEIGVIVYSPMQSGLLSGTMTHERIKALPKDDWRLTKAPEFQEPRLSRNLRLVEELRTIGKRHGHSPGEVAIAWTLRRPEVTAAIVGARRPSQVEGFVGAAGFRLSNEELDEIQRLLSMP